MTFQTETVLSCSVPPSSRGFERLNTERDRGIGGAGGGPTGRLAGMAGDRPLESARGRRAVAVRLLPMPRGAAGERGDREHGPAADQPAAEGDEHLLGGGERGGSDPAASGGPLGPMGPGVGSDAGGDGAGPTDGLALGAAGLPGGDEGARRPGRGIAATINEETL